MSKIGRTPVHVPAGVTVTVQDGMVVVKGPKGELQEKLAQYTAIAVEGEHAQVSVTSESRQAKANYGLMRSLLNNMVIGVTQGFSKRLELVGTGYRVAKQGAGLNLSLGFSHPVILAAVPGIEFAVEGNNAITITGAQKYLVGQVAANLRKLRPPEPYKGKGIRYADETVRRKQGKTGAK